MEDGRLGLAIRALRRRRRWRQADLAHAAGVSQATVSLMERGHLDDATVRVIRKVVGALEGRAAIDFRWRGAALDRLLDERHAALGSKVVEVLVACGWDAQVEVSYSSYGERGAIDVLGWHAETRSLLVVELKTDIASVEELLRKHDEKVRLGPRIARERWNWRPAVVARVLVLPEDGTSRRRWAAAGNLLSAVLPSSSVDVKRWIREPRGPLAGVWFCHLAAVVVQARVLTARNGSAAPSAPWGAVPVASRAAG